MDVYLSRSALIQLKTIFLFSSSAEGILSGHRQGQRYFVENITAVSGALTLPMEKHLQMQDLLQDSFLGYFSSPPLEDLKNKVLGPSVLGKVILEVTAFPAQKDGLQAYVIEYDGAFILSPIKSKIEKSRQKDLL